MEPLERIGLVDLDGDGAALVEVVERFDLAQPRLRFSMVAPRAVACTFPRGRDALRAWARAHDCRVDDARLDALDFNVAADDFLDEGVRRLGPLRLTYLVGLTSARVAFAADDELRYDYLSVGRDDVSLISIADLELLATKAKRPLPMAIAHAVLSVLLSDLAELELHDEPRDHPCLFDVHTQRLALVDSLREPAVHDDCLEQMAEPLRQAAAKLVDTLSRWT
jgi:hypothetical protein